MTSAKFLDSIHEMFGRVSDRDYEEYLSALYSLMMDQKGTGLDDQKFFTLIESAFTSKPAPFQEEWLQITDCPEWHPEYQTEEQEFQYSLDVIRFQIAEFHRMRGKQLDLDRKGDGITSDTGHSWYNFDPFSILSCGANCLRDRSKNPEAEWTITWDLVGDLLEMGRIYE